MRDRFTVANEKTLFPGLAILALALAGVAFAPWSRRVRLGLAAGVVVVAVFSLGVRFLGGHVTYRLLYEYAPGWEGIRTPGRLNTLTSLGLALLAGGGASAVAARVRGRRLAAALPALLCLAVLVEGSGFAVGKEGRGALAGPIAKTVPDPPPGQVGLGGPRLHLPVRTYLRSFPYMLWTTDDFAPIVNGISGFPPRFLDRLSRRVEGFPSRASVDYLRGIGVRYVVLHPDDVARTPWRNWRRRPVRGLGVRRRQTGGVVVYDLGRRSKQPDPAVAAGVGQPVAVPRAAAAGCRPGRSCRRAGPPPRRAGAGPASAAAGRGTRARSAGSRRRSGWARAGPRASRPPRCCRPRRSARRGACGRG